MKFVKPKNRPVTRVFIHCSASDRPEDDNVATITAWHKARKFSTIGYHFYINKNGICFNGRDIELIPAAQEGYNSGSIAICLGGLRDFTPEQFATLKDLCQQINRTYAGFVTFHGHCEVSAKTCPVFDYKTVLGLADRGDHLDQKGFMKL